MGFHKEDYENRGGSSVSEAALYRKDDFAFLKRQMAMSFSRAVFLSSKKGLEGTTHPADRLHGQKAQGKVQESVLASKSGDRWWNNETEQLPKMFGKLIQSFCGKTASLLKINALFLHLAPAVWLNLMERTRRYIVDHGYTLFGLLPVGVAVLEVQDGNLEVNESGLFYEPKLPDLVPLKNGVLQPF